MDIALGLLAVVALVLANGYFVLGEFAFVACRREQIEALAENGDRRAVRTLGVLRRLSFMLSGAQLGITVTSLLVGFIAEPVFAAALGPPLGALGVPPTAATGVALTSGLLLSTTAQMVFGELAPKNLGIARPEFFSLALARSTGVFLTVAGPVITVFDSSSNRLLRAVGVEPVEELSTGVSAEELDLLVQESGEGGVLTPDQAALMTRVLDFRHLRAAEALVPRRQVVTIPADASCDDLRHAAVETGHSRFPVVGDDPDEVLGVVQAKAVFDVDVQFRSTTPVRELMVPALVVPEAADLANLLAGLRQSHSALAVVVDEYGGIAGIVTIEDIVEELVGQIRDEYDPEEPSVTALPGGGYLVPGSWRPDEVTRETGVELPTGEFETLGGLLMERLGRVPDVDDAVEVEGARLSVHAMDGHAVAGVRVVPEPRGSGS